MADRAVGNSGAISEMDVRIWLRDTDPAANLLINDFEFSPEEIRTAMTLAVDYWNDLPPYLQNAHFTVNNFPFRSAFMRGTAANLLFIAAHRFRRNALKYSVPGGAISDQEKYQEYDAAGDRVWQEYKDWVARIKRAINVEQGWAVSWGDDMIYGRS